MTAPIPRDIPDLPPIPRTHALLPSAVPASAVVPPVRRTLATVLRLLIAALAASGVTLALLLGSPLRVLSHFSVQSAILLTLVTAASARRAWTARKPLPPALTGAALLYALVSALAYHLLLADTTPPFSLTNPGTAPTASAWDNLANVLLHTAIPAAAVLDWLFLTPPGRLRLRQAAPCLLYPLAYLAFTFTRAALLPPDHPARYLYPFLDADTDGYKHTLANALILGLSCYTLALLLVALDHTRPNPVRHHWRNRISSQAASGLK